jgi:predicted nucleic acid-binding protein
VIFLLDTNVLSENAKGSPEPAVVAFLRAVPVENIRLSAVVLAEIAQGVENNPTPELKEFLADVLALPLAEFGEMEALEWGRFCSPGPNDRLAAASSLSSRVKLIPHRLPKFRLRTPG